MYNFDEIIEHPKWTERKWGICKDNEIPMWIAVMDFPVAPQIMEALKERISYPSFGYDTLAMDALKCVPSYYQRTFGCHVKQKWVTLVHSVMTGVNVACLTAGGRIMYCIPMYTHIRKVGAETGLPVTEVLLMYRDGKYTFDFDAMEAAYTPDVKSFILCNPHNPTGRVFTKEELEGVIRFCKKHDIVLISDEIHCEIVFEGKHIPAFSLGDEDFKSVTLYSGGKIGNVPRLPMGFAVIPNEELRNAFEKETHGLFGRGETMNAVAFQILFDGSCDDWKTELITYLKENRDYMEERILRMPGIAVNHNEATYLAWIDCSKLGKEEPKEFFRKEAKVIFNDGGEFGTPKAVRINFACPRAQLREALDRMEKVLQKEAGNLG